MNWKNAILETDFAGETSAKANQIIEVIKWAGKLWAHVALRIAIHTGRRHKTPIIFRCYTAMVHQHGCQWSTPGCVKCDWKWDEGPLTACVCVKTVSTDDWSRLHRISRQRNLVDAWVGNIINSYSHPKDWHFQKTHFPVILTGCILSESDDAPI